MGTYPYPYPVRAYCRFCKMERGVWAMQVEEYRKLDWKEVDGTPALSKVTAETVAEVEAWIERRGEQWKQVWAEKAKERAAVAAYLKTRRAEMRMEEEVARMQIDEVNTDVTDDESANRGCEEDCVLGGSY